MSKFCSEIEHHRLFNGDVRSLSCRVVRNTIQCRGPECAFRRKKKEPYKSKGHSSGCFEILGGWWERIFPRKRPPSVAGMNVPVLWVVNPHGVSTHISSSKEVASAVYSLFPMPPHVEKAGPLLSPHLC